jgi:hypothetical protein
VAVQEEVSREVERWVGQVLEKGEPDLEAWEMGLRDRMHRVGAVLLERLLNADGRGYQGSRPCCPQGHTAVFVKHRSKQVLTVLGPVEVRRAYYHCPTCQAGMIPRDEVLDIVGSSFSPGVRRMMSRVGSKESFQDGRQDLKELAGLEVTAKQVERISEQLGQQAQSWQAPTYVPGGSGKVVKLKSIPKLYIAYDGTGVPVVSRETEGRAGKQSPQAKSREAKLGCIFTQTAVDEQNQPVRDEGSTTYVGAIEAAEAFGLRIYTEAVRRGLEHAQRVIVLGDGAPWIWKIADEHFPEAIQIVDLYHARQHVAELAKPVLGSVWKPWAEARYRELDQGKVEALLGALLRLKAPQPDLQAAIDKALHYFQTNADRMRYAKFRRQGLFVGSGVVEAGCKTIVGQRLKQSGMHWTVRGANAIIALRCLDLSNLWEDFWESRKVG